MQLPTLLRDEEISLRLRALYEENGYGLYRMGSFEEYDFYLQNKSFLMDADVITFTGTDGRLMALRPDVTLSIVKSTKNGEVRRVYYNENVFRHTRQSGEYKEIRQIGLECIGGGASAEKEVLGLVLKSLELIGKTALDVSHMGVVEGVLGLFEKTEHQKAAAQALQNKSGHAMKTVAENAGLSDELTNAVVALVSLSGEFFQTLQNAKQLAKDIPGALSALQELENIVKSAEIPQNGVCVRLDFSIVNDAGYYNGLIFKGYAEGVPVPILGGGRYDNLLHRQGKTQGAVGFALPLDALGLSDVGAVSEGDDWLKVALPKGRLAEKMHGMFSAIGLTEGEMDKKSRKLVWEDEKSKIRYFLVKPTDVDIYVEHGVADIGVVGKDILLENNSDVLELLDLKFGKCRFAVAAHVDYKEDTTRVLRVATKYTEVARKFYAQKSRNIELIELHGSIELAPLIGLADVIVDIVETGSTLKENDLHVIEDVAFSSARLIANRASQRFKQDRIATLCQKLEVMV